jgi:hypothetical protein
LQQEEIISEEEVEEDGGYNYLRVILVLVLIIVPILLILVTIRYHVPITNWVVPKVRVPLLLVSKGVKTLFAKKEKVPEKEVPEPVIDVNMQDLKEYIQKYTKQGFTKSEIENQLESEGIPKDVVKKAFD